MSNSQEVVGSEALCALAYGATQYRRLFSDQSGFHAVSSDDQIGISYRDYGDIEVTVRHGDGQRQYVLAPDYDLLPSPWFELGGIIPAFKEASRSGAADLDITAEAARLQKLMALTDLVSTQTICLTSDQHRALRYLRSATMVVDKWQLNLAGPIGIYSVKSYDNGHPLNHFWSGWSLPRPLDTLKPTLILQASPNRQRPIIVSPALLTSEKQVRPYDNSLEQMKGLRDLEQDLGAAVADELFQFAEMFRAS